jgi:ferritin-like metal-binding protein YciE
MKSLKDLLIHELRDMHNAEKQLVKALPKMARAASHDELRNAFQGHLEETEHHVQRIEEALKLLDKSPRGTKCEGMAGIIAECEELIKSEKSGDANVLDAGLIAAAQRAEHYEIAVYGSAVAFATLLGERDVARMLQESLDEETAVDKLLTSIAEGTVNAEAKGQPA